MDQRGRRQARYVAASMEKTLGALPVIADFSRRLDLAGIIDRVCPVRDVAHLTHGQVIQALVANRLSWVGCSVSNRPRITASMHTSRSSNTMTSVVVCWRSRSRAVRAGSGSQARVVGGSGRMRSTCSTGSITPFLSLWCCTTQ
jgi:hypothetical protein